MKGNEKCDVKFHLVAISLSLRVISQQIIQPENYGFRSDTVVCGGGGDWIYKKKKQLWHNSFFLSPPKMGLIKCEHCRPLIKMFFKY